MQHAFAQTAHPIVYTLLACFVLGLLQAAAAQLRK
jgi:hypothetical protein